MKKNIVLASILAMAIVTFPVSAQSKNVQLHKSTVIGDKTQRAYQIS